MDVITAPEQIKQTDDPSVFLAGGITNCPLWQNSVIEMLRSVQGLIYNPRRENFPIHDPGAAEEQITWEFNALNSADVFSMWFCAGESDQPICMYELGRHVALRVDDAVMLGEDAEKMINQIVIGIEPGYRRESDVRIQMSLIHRELADKIVDNLEDHAIAIQEALEWTSGHLLKWI